MTDSQVQYAIQALAVCFVLGPLAALVIYDMVCIFLRAVQEWLS